MSAKQINHPRFKFLPSVAMGLMLCWVTQAGCRTPWQSMRSPEPNLESMVYAEQKSPSSQNRSPLGRKLRPGEEAHSPENRLSHSRFAAIDDLAEPKSNATVPRDVLHGDREFSEAYADASPVERALIDRMSNALANQSRTHDEGSVAASSRAGVRQKSPGEVPPSSSDTVRRSISDSSNDTMPEDEQIAFNLNDASEESSRQSPRSKAEPTSRSSLADRFADNHSNDSSTRRNARQDAAVVSASYEMSAERKEAESANEPTYTPELETELSNFELRELGYAMIEKLEAQDSAITNPDERVNLALKRRLLNMVLDDLESAEEDIEGLQPEAQNYIRHTFHGLYDATDINGNPVANRRLTLALQSHRKASEYLEQVSNLEVINVSFCTEVDSFGVITKFSEYNFRPDQEVLLYCELENFVSQKISSGYETQLQGSYEIINSDGRRIADQLLPVDSDVCGKKRRDFYIAYRLHMPDDIEPGRYSLQLTIEDMKGHKFGQSKIDFQIIR